jgi:hypothetical protein
MNQPDPVPTPSGPAVPWYESKVQIAQVTALISAIVAMFPKVGTYIGITTATQVAPWVETVFGFIALAAPLVGTVLRAKSKYQPLTLTQAGADSHPATIAARNGNH